MFGSFFQGDIRLTPEQESIMLKGNNNSPIHRHTGFSNPNFRWRRNPQGQVIVPYRIGPREGFSELQKIIFLEFINNESQLQLLTKSTQFWPSSVTSSDRPAFALLSAPIMSTLSTSSIGPVAGRIWDGSEALRSSRCPELAACSAASQLTKSSTRSATITCTTTLIATASCKSSGRTLYPATRSLSRRWTRAGLITSEPVTICCQSCTTRGRPSPATVSTLSPRSTQPTPTRSALKFSALATWSGSIECISVEFSCRKCGVRVGTRVNLNKYPTIRSDDLPKSHPKHSPPSFSSKKTRTQKSIRKHFSCLVARSLFAAVIYLAGFIYSSRFAHKAGTTTSSSSRTFKTFAKRPKFDKKQNSDSADAKSRLREDLVLLEQSRSLLALFLIRSFDGNMSRDYRRWGSNICLSLRVILAKCS